MMLPDALKAARSGASSNVHASCVACDDRGLLIVGRAGSGKSALALSLMGLGARLVADDRVLLCRSGEAVMASAPETGAGLIEARGLGILRAPVVEQARVKYVLDLERTETARLPEFTGIELLGCTLPLLGAVDSPHFAPALLQLLKAGRLCPETAPPGVPME